MTTFQFTVCGVLVNKDILLQATGVSFPQDTVSNPTGYDAAPSNGYVAEDGTAYYVAEDGTTFYVQES